MFCSVTTIICIPTEQIRKRNPSPTTEHKSITIDNDENALSSPKDDRVNSLIVTYTNGEKRMKEELKRWRESVPIPPSIEEEPGGVDVNMLDDIIAKKFSFLYATRLFLLQGAHYGCK